MVACDVKETTVQDILTAIQAWIGGTSSAPRFVRTAYAGTHATTTITPPALTAPFFGADTTRKRGYFVANPSGVLLNHQTFLTASASSVPVANAACDGPFPRTRAAGGYNGSGVARTFSHIRI